MFFYSTWTAAVTGVGAGGATTLPPIRANLEQTQVPNTIHMASIDCAPELRIHRMARQCGADAKTGDMKNPNNDIYAQ